MWDSFYCSEPPQDESAEIVLFLSKNNWHRKKRSFFLERNRLINSTKGKKNVEEETRGKIPTNSVNVAIFCQIHPNLSLFAGYVARSVEVMEAKKFFLWLMLFLFKGAKARKKKEKEPFSFLF